MYVTTVDVAVRARSWILGGLGSAVEGGHRGGFVEEWLDGGEWSAVSYQLPPLMSVRENEQKYEFLELIAELLRHCLGDFSFGLETFRQSGHAFAWVTV